MTENNIGKTLYIATAVPANNDADGFEALSWVKVNGVQSLPQLGISHSMIDVPDLQSGFTSSLKGAATGVDTTMTFRTVDSDTGQANLEAQAVDQSGLLSVKLVKGSGAAQAPAAGDPVEYAQGIAHSFQPNQGDNSTFEGFQVGFKQNDFTVIGTEPSP